MTEATNAIIIRVEEALRQGDQRTASMLLHQVLTQDFTNPQAWQILYMLRGAGQDFPSFQQAFAQKYYPQYAHLLAASPVADAQPRPLAAAAAPNRISPVFPAPAQATGTGTVRLQRLKGYVGSMVKLPVIIDGQETGKIANGEAFSYTLPAGQHTVIVKLRRNASQPAIIDLRPGDDVLLATQLPKFSLKAVGPDLEIVPPGAPLPKVRNIFQYYGVLGCVVILIAGCFGSTAGYFLASLLLNN